jgi:TATA-binding protein-associated factor Taf7
MSREPREFEISKLLNLADKEKYATTVAAFEVIDKLEQIEIPRRYVARKPAVKAMIALSEGIVRYDYISDEDRRALEEELNGPIPVAGQPVDPRSRVPVVEESDEDLGDEDVGEIEPADKLVEDREEGDEAEAEEEEEEDEEEEDEDDDSDDEEEEEEPAKDD